MKYKGKELTELKANRPVAYDPPREMLVWDECNDERGNEPVKRKVAAILPSLCYPVIAVPGNSHAHCAEIPKMTNWDTFQQRYGTEKIDVRDAITKFIYSHMRCDFCPAKQQCGNLHTGVLETCVNTFEAWATAEYKETK